MQSKQSTGKVSHQSQVYVFDLFGTLLDLEAAFRSREFGAPWRIVAALWRARQLELAWADMLLGESCDLSAASERALDATLQLLGLASAPALRRDLLADLRTPPAFLDARPSLMLMKRSGGQLAVLSNGSSDAIKAAVRAADLENVFDLLLSTEATGAFKPDARAYGEIGDVLVVQPQEVVFVSANSWDAVGAARAGFNAFWLNRTGGVSDRQLGRVREVQDLAQLLSQTTEPAT